MKKAVVLVLVAVLGGCISVGTKVDPAKLSALQPGISTQADIVAALGEPNSVSRLPDGSILLGYSSIEARPSAANFIPIVGPFVGKVQTRSQYVQLMLGPDGKLKNTAGNTYQGRAGFTP